MIAETTSLQCGCLLERVRDKKNPTGVEYEHLILNVCALHRIMQEILIRPRTPMVLP